jgi:hypothetical protein
VPSGAERPSKGDPLDAIVLTASADCSGTETPLRAAEEGETLKRMLERDFGLKVKSYHEPSHELLLDVIARPRRTPLLVYFGGHGVLLPDDPYRGQSAICSSGQPLLVEHVVHALPKDAPFVFLLLNACFSAHVDVRIEQPPLAVLSAHSGRLDTTAMNDTVLGQLLPAAFSSAADANHDATISDVELFRWIERAAQPAYPGDPFQPHPKLRAQTDAALPVLRLDRKRIEFASAKTRAPPRVSVDRRPPHTFVRVEGFIAPDGKLHDFERTWSMDQLFAFPCAESTGQCFLVRSASPEKW